MSILGWLFGSEQSYRYRTTQGHSFDFSLSQQSDGTVRIYINGAPSYGHRSTDGHSTHRYHDPERGHFVCIQDDLAPTNIADAREWARYWAENTSNFITTGREFS